MSDKEDFRQILQGDYSTPPNLDLRRKENKHLRKNKLLDKMRGVEPPREPPQAPAVPQSRPSRLTIDEMLDTLTSIARDEDAGLDRMRAMKMLSGMSDNQVVLDAPLDEDEVVSRLSRLQRAAGPAATFGALRKSFSQKVREEWIRAMDREDNPYRDPAKPYPKTLEELYKDFPQSKPPGYPVQKPDGYPESGSPADKMRWCRREGYRYLQKQIEAGRGLPLDLKEPA